MGHRESGSGAKKLLPAVGGLPAQRVVANEDVVKGRRACVLGGASGNPATSCRAFRQNRGRRQSAAMLHWCSSMPASAAYRANRPASRLQIRPEVSVVADVFANCDDERTTIDVVVECVAALVPTTLRHTRLVALEGPTTEHVGALREEVEPGGSDDFRPKRSERISGRTVAQVRPRCIHVHVLGVR